MMRTACVFLALCGTAFAAPRAQSHLLNVTKHEKHCTGDCQQGDKNSLMHKMHMMQKKEIEWALCAAEGKCPVRTKSLSNNVPCEGGQSGEYRCDGVDMFGFVSLADMVSQTDSIRV